VIVINETDISKTARDMVRASFNPSGISHVDRIKLLAAALITACEVVRDGRDSGADDPGYPAKPDAAREVALAITNIEQGAMWAVKAATKGA
jgi:hypothetical protein